MFIVYGTPTCQWCKRTKELLQEKNISYDYVELISSSTILRFQKDCPGAKTVPQIIADGIWIGGYEDLIKYLR